jgi:hypothetical protein
MFNWFCVVVSAIAASVVVSTFAKAANVVPELEFFASFAVMVVSKLGKVVVSVLDC